MTFPIPAVTLRGLRVALFASLVTVLAAAGAQAQTFLMANGAQWESCAGTIYDSGGAAGNYGNSESMVATLCPTGGAGSGPQSSVTFTQWGVAVGLADVLTVHNGATTGTVIATGNGLVSLQGQSFTSTDPSGCLTFQWSSDLLLTGTGWAITIDNAPDAGGNGTFTVCSTAPAFDLFTKLTGTPDPGGQWTLGGALVSNTYTPGVSAAGTYTYTIQGVSPCPGASATVVITEVAAALAGGDNIVTKCSSDAAFDLRDQLIGPHASSGTWAGPSPVVNNLFTPGSMIPGIYIYTVAGTAPCASDQAQVEVIVRTAPNAGTNANNPVCSSSGAFDMFTLLGGADAGGVWTAPNNTATDNIFQPGTDAAGTYTYTVTGQVPCPADVATVSVSVQQAAFAGTSTDSTVCSNGASVNMRNMLGTGLSAGSWTSGPTMPVVNDLYNPVSMLPGVYTYTATGTAPCPNVTATVNMSEVTAPNAGIGATRAVCSNGANVDLFAQLTGSPNSGGTWTAPGNVPFPSGVFVPGTNPAGNYTYTVVGQAPCANAASIVVINVVPAPDPGTNGTARVCSNGPVFALLDSLGGDPDSPGNWTKPNGTPLSSGNYDPTNAGHPAGVYQYVATGTPPCANATSSVTVIETAAPNAGTNGSLSLCSSGAPVNLGTGLGGGPGGNGTWYSPTNVALPNGLFNPSTGAIGVYKYVILGTGPCANDTGFVSVAVTQAPNAGQNGDTLICCGTGNLPLLSVLNGAPQGGGTWSVGNGTFSCATSQEGAFTYTVVGTSPCPNATATATVETNRLPQAGSNGSVTLCSTEPPINLFSRLGVVPQPPDPGGTWSPGDPTGVYDPEVNAQGTYTYTVAGAAPCPNATATVQVTENAAPDPGEDADVTVCQDATSVDLFAALGGDPDAGGEWDPVGNISPGILSGNSFILNNAPPGMYRFHYELPGNGQCPPDQSEVEVQVVNSLNAGSNGAPQNVCNSNLAYNLFNAIGGGPQPGGTWTAVGNTGQLNGSFLNASSLAPGNGYTFKYKLAGSAGCNADSATATINIIAKPFAGGTGTAAFCSNQSSTFQLADYLTGEQGGGQWRKQGVAGAHPGSYQPSSSTVPNSPGLFFYIVQGSSPCPADTGRVTVTENVAPNAGNSASYTTCEVGPFFNMLSKLGGSPSATGTWTTPGGQITDVTFTPGVDPCGTYSYTVTGSGACPNAVSQLTVNCAELADPGLPGDTSVCSNGDDFFLFFVLNGSPDQGGVFRALPSGTLVVNGLYDPSSMAPGDYAYIVSGETPCAVDTAIVTVFENEEPDAGIPANTSICPTGGVVDLFTRLGGTPDPGGTWSDGFDGTYDPVTDNPGVFTYTVSGIPPCPSDAASVTVTEATVPNAGVNTTINVCTSDNAFLLNSRLNGSPDPGGSWTVNGTPSSPLFDPDVNAAGTYVCRYRLVGNLACGPDSAILTINLNEEANAGGTGAVSACANGGEVNLFDTIPPDVALGPPDIGGTWTAPNGSAFDGTFQPGADAAGVYEYYIDGAPGCADDSTIVTVGVNPVPNAGISGLRIMCSTEGSLLLSTVLGGTPAQNGSWSGPSGSPGVYTPSLNDPGTFTYTVVGQSPCANAQATVTIIENQAVNAGIGGALAVCSDQDEFALIDSLEGTPTGGGSWFGPDQSLVTGFFNPLTSPIGPYRYEVDGLEPCLDASAIINVVVHQAPDAGISTAPQICAGGGDVQLIDLLGGNPDAGGQWYKPNGATHGDEFDPEDDPGGTYTYVVLGESPCGADTSTVTITLVPAPNAGTDGTLAACTANDSVILITGVVGDPALNGTWTGPQTNGVFNAAAAGVGQFSFNYIVGGNGSCEADTAIVVVTVTAALQAGNDGALDVCEGLDLDLNTLLSVNATAGGYWVDVGGSGALAGSVFDASAAGDGTWAVRYVLTGSTGCPGDSSDFVLTVIPGPDAGGDDDNVERCSNVGTVQLISLLEGTPDLTGSWYYGPTFTPIGSSLNTATAPSGEYHYIVPGSGGCGADSSLVVVTIYTAPNAGQSDDLTVCETGSPVTLLAALGGAPQPGGTWTFGVGLSNGIYDPALNNPGDYTYTVEGQDGVCADATAVVTVEEQEAPDAGGDNAQTLCSSGITVNMTSMLAGFPQTTGQWFDPNDIEHVVTFDPDVDEAGVWTYVVGGGGACDPDSALLTLNVVSAPFAGEDSSFSVCSTADSVALFSALGALADTGGTWTDLDGAGAAFVDGVLDASQVAFGTYDFQYALPASSPCLGDLALVSVTVGAGLDPGVGGNDTICGGDPAYSLFSSLSGTPSAGGVWAEGSGAVSIDPVTGVVDASALVPGDPYLFSYTVTDPGCGVASSLVTLFTAAFPDPGADSSVVVCATSAGIPLIGLLGGNPQLGGVWTDAEGDPVPAIFNPATQGSGVFNYTLTGSEPCADSTASVTITVNTTANAGTDGNTQACNNGVLPLATLLGGGAQPGGVWSVTSGQATLNVANLVLDDLVPGFYGLRYTVTVAGCGTDAADFVISVVGPVEVVDTTLTCNEALRTYTVALVLSGGDPATYSVTGLPGTLTQVAPYTFTSDPVITSEPFSLVVNDANNCGALSITGDSPCDFENEVFVPESFTPNGDNINDVLVIPGIEGFPGNTVAIFNRWGAEVYQAAGYDNKEVRWDGTSTDALIPGELPTGTYYYVLELGNGGEPYKGFIYLNR